MKSNACLCCLAPDYSRQDGVALILALLIMAIVAAMATYLHSDFDRTMRFAGNRMHSIQGDHFLRGGEAFAQYYMAEDLKDNEVDHLGEYWASPYAFPFENGGIQLQLEDMQGRLNINNLQARVSSGTTTRRATTAAGFTPSQRRFIRLLQTFEDVPLSENEAIEITQAVIDWLDKDDDTTGFGGAESSYYQSAGVDYGVPGYRPANREIKSVSELRLIKGVTPELYQLVQPYLCALPVGVELNINTASGRVLRTLNIASQLSPLSPADGSELEADRGDNGFADTDAFFNTTVMADLQAKALRKEKELNSDLLSVSSSYFMLNADAVVGERHSYSSSLLHRTADTVRVIGRRLGN